MSNFTYDVRVIRLIKTTNSNSLQNFFDSEKENGYICLGHFDIMKIDSLPNDKDPLEAIQFDSRIIRGKNIAEENYVYPLYILQQHDDIEQSEIKNAHKNFWEKETNYITVTRFHCDSVDTGDKSFREILSERCKNRTIRIDEQNKVKIELSECCQDCYDKLSVYITEDLSVEVFIAFYDSLELGDIVCVARSDSIAALLEVQRHLFECEVVSDEYTYCGIHKDFFGSDELFKEKTEASSDLLDTATVDFISTRCSVKLALEMDLFFGELRKKDILKGKQYFVTGTADAVIDWGTLSEKKFLEAMRGICHNSHFYHAFNDVITRIGLQYMKPINSRTRLLIKPSFTDRVKHYERVREILSSPDCKFSWRYQLLRLLETLRTMYHNSVMDDLSMLLLPGVEALLERICHIYLHECSKTSALIHDRDILHFLDCWTTLMNDISHLESQLVQHPELSPVRYYIPAMVLQFERHCIERCAAVLDSIEQEVKSGQEESECIHSCTFSPILVPSSDCRVRTRCILDSWNDSKNYTGENPLRILLPIDRLYQPWAMAHVLCHEIAHYCGNAIRLRDSRLECLIRCTSDYLLNLFDVFIKRDIISDESDLLKFENFRDKLTLQISTSYPRESGNHSLYLSKVWELLPVATWGVASSEDIMNEYQDLIVEQMDEEKQLQYLRKLNSLNRVKNIPAIQGLCFDHIQKCLIPLCKECYADIAMILLLKCSFHDYYHSIFADEYSLVYPASATQNISGDEDESEEEVVAGWKNDQHVDRISLVAIVISSPSIRDDKWLKTDLPEEDLWVKYAQKKIKNWRSKKQWYRAKSRRHEVNRYSLSKYEIQIILDYLLACASKLMNQVEKMEENNEELESLRKQVNYAKSSAFDWRGIRKILEQDMKT